MFCPLNNFFFFVIAEPTNSDKFLNSWFVVNYSLKDQKNISPSCFCCSWFIVYLINVFHWIIWLEWFQVGENGAGKTTLLKILLGELNPVRGLRNAHRNLKIGYFSQHHVDQLEMDVSSVELLALRFPGKHWHPYS